MSVSCCLYFPVISRPLRFVRPVIRLVRNRPVVACGLAGVFSMDRPNSRLSVELENVPYILGGMAELAAGNAGTEVELANGDAVVLDVIREVIVALGHGANEDCDTLALIETADVVADTYNFRIEAKRNLAAIWREMISNGVLNHLDKLFLG